MELPVLYAPIEQGPAIVAGRPKVLPMLETIREPGRNNALVDVCAGSRSEHASVV